MNITERDVQIYLTRAGKCPFASWFDRLRDRVGQAKIAARITRLRSGNFGDWKSVGEGMAELRIAFGPGYRIYIGLDGPTIVILLIGGDKSTQQRDIAQAKDFWNDYKENKTTEKY